MPRGWPLPCTSIHHAAQITVSCIVKVSSDEFRIRLYLYLARRLPRHLSAYMPVSLLQLIIAWPEMQKWRAALFYACCCWIQSLHNISYCMF